nr:MAG TPA: hypothetical protein [Caudoviricetes sp.]
MSFPTYSPPPPNLTTTQGRRSIKISAISYEVGKVQTRAYRNFFSAALAQFLKNRVAFKRSFLTSCSVGTSFFLPSGYGSVRYGTGFVPFLAKSRNIGDASQRAS